MHRLKHFGGDEKLFERKKKFKAKPAKQEEPKISRQRSQHRKTFTLKDLQD